jgi:hypothetical protein
MNAFREMLTRHVISRNGDVHWTASSPNLSAFACFIWECLTSTVYTRRNVAASAENWNNTGTALEAWQSASEGCVLYEIK